MVAFSLARQRDGHGEEASSRLAGFLCLLGLFVHILISDGLLDALGWRYTSDTGGTFVEKFHPGSLLIYLSFFILLWQHGNPFRRIIEMFRYERIASILVLVYMMIFAYMSIRSGTSGIAFILDIHITVPMAVIVLCFTPTRYCRVAIHLAVGIACLNSAIGIMESLGRFRIFDFNPEVAFVNEDTFRASALRGHPLSNAAFTAIMSFMICGMPYPKILKVPMIALLSVSLVAFGGRTSLAVAILGLSILGSSMFWQLLKKGKLSLLQIILLLGGALTLPLAFAGGLFAALSSDMGERILAHAHWDDSANARALAFMVFDYMTTEQIVFGISAEQVLEVAHRVNLDVPLSDIENPWLLMLMYLGAIMFPVWLIATFLFIHRLIRGLPLALKMAIIGYFMIASTANSFGRKDPLYLITASIVVCAGRSLSFSRQPAKASEA